MTKPNPLTQAQRVKYAEGTAHKHKATKPVNATKPVKPFPADLTKKLAKPDKFTVLGTDGLDEGPVADDAPPPRYYASYDEPTFRCALCKELYKLEFIRFHRPVALKPELMVCSFCFKDNDLSAVNTQAASDQPRTTNQATQATQARTTIKAKTIPEKVVLATQVLTELYGSTIAGFTSTELEATITAYIEEVSEVDKHGVAYFELFFNKNHQLNNPEGLINDFTIFATFA